MAEDPKYMPQYVKYCTKASDSIKKLLSVIESDINMKSESREIAITQCLNIKQYLHNIDKNISMDFNYIKKFKKTQRKKNSKTQNSKSKTKTPTKCNIFPVASIETVEEMSVTEMNNFIKSNFPQTSKKC